MKLNLYDENLNKIAIIGGQFISCLWKEDYNGKGNFSIELNNTEEYRKKVKTDCYVGRKDRKTLMVIKTVNIKDGAIVATGALATRQLEDVAFIGTINENSTIATSVKNAYNVSTKYQNIEIADSDLTEKYPQQISNKSFFALTQTMCKSADIGFRPVKNGNKIDIEFYKPTINSNLKFSKMFGNLSNENIVLSTENYKNYAIVLGQGEAENRTRVDVDISNGEQRKELIVDAKDLQQNENETLANYQKRLTARGVEKLLEKTKTWSVKFLPSATEFGKGIDIGDILTVLLKEYDLIIQARLASFTQKEQNNSTTTTIEVGEITVTGR